MDYTPNNYSYYNNPNYGSNYGYTPTTNNYASPYQMYNQPSYQPQTNYNSQPTQKPLVGRYINNPNDITVNEVPTDGSIGLFPQTDGSCVYGKVWNANGTITTIKYIPEVQNAETSETTIDFDSLNSKIDAIYNHIFESKQTTNQTSRNRNNVKKDGPNA